MHIVMISDSETSGGASIAAARLASALADAGNKVTRIVFSGDKGVHPWDTVTLRLHQREDLLLKPIRVLPFNAGVKVRAHLVSRALDQLLRQLSPEVISIHNVHGAEWPHQILDVCSRHAPVAWTLHDCWSFTGHCSYYYGCEKYRTGCDATCPWPDEYPPMKPGKIAGSWKARSTVLRRNPGIVAVTPSGWLAGEAGKGIWKGHRIEVIPNSIPLDVYRPEDQKLARAALEISDGSPVLIAAAENLNDRRKGGKLLIEALHLLKTRPLTVVTFGSRLPAIDIENMRLRQLGFVDPERVKVLAYNAADLFVHPATVDNLPNVILEAMACGVPSVGFPIGGMPDMIHNGVTGWLAKDVSAGSLAGTIDAALAGGIDLRDSCRKAAEAEYGPALQAERYVKLFESMLKAKQVIS